MPGSDNKGMQKEKAFSFASLGDLPTCQAEHVLEAELDILLRFLGLQWRGEEFCSVSTKQCSYCVYV